MKKEDSPSKDATDVETAARADRIRRAKKEGGIEEGRKQFLKEVNNILKF